MSNSLPRSSTSSSRLSKPTLSNSANSTTSLRTTGATPSSTRIITTATKTTALNGTKAVGDIIWTASPVRDINTMSLVTGPSSNVELDTTTQVLNPTTSSNSANPTATAAGATSSSPSSSSSQSSLPIPLFAIIAIAAGAFLVVAVLACYLVKRHRRHKYGPKPQPIPEVPWRPGAPPPTRRNGPPPRRNPPPRPRRPSELWTAQPSRLGPSGPMPVGMKATPVDHYKSQPQRRAYENAGQRIEMKPTARELRLPQMIHAPVRPNYPPHTYMAMVPEGVRQPQPAHAPPNRGPQLGNQWQSTHPQEIPKQLAPVPPELESNRAIRERLYAKVQESTKNIPHTPPPQLIFSQFKTPPAPQPVHLPTVSSSQSSQSRTSTPFTDPFAPYRSTSPSSISESPPVKLRPLSPARQSFASSVEPDLRSGPLDATPLSPELQSDVSQAIERLRRQPSHVASIQPGHRVPSYASTQTGYNDPSSVLDSFLDDYSSQDEKRPMTSRNNTGASGMTRIEEDAEEEEDVRRQRAYSPALPDSVRTSVLSYFRLEREGPIQSRPESDFSIYARP